MAIVTLGLIAVTCGVSYAGFMKPAVVRKYIFNPESILADKEFYRLVTSAFLHADGRHLFFNMLTLFLFGSRLFRQIARLTAFRPARRIIRIRTIPRPPETGI